MRVISFLALLMLAACGPSLPTPAMARHSGDAFQEVPYPPPAALAESVPPRPDRPNVVWIDGEWTFRGDTFVWRRGGWVEPPEGSRYAPWQSWYQADGRLMLAPGTWYDADGEALTEPILPVVSAYTPPNRLTSESQTGR
jgi:hypothetical protein